MSITKFFVLYRVFDWLASGILRLRTEAKPFCWSGVCYSITVERTLVIVIRGILLSVGLIVINLLLLLLLVLTLTLLKTVIVRRRRYYTWNRCCDWLRLIGRHCGIGLLIMGSNVVSLCHYRWMLINRRSGYSLVTESFFIIEMMDFRRHLCGVVIVIGNEFRGNLSWIICC